MGRGYVMRSALPLAENGYVAVVVAPPSDRPQGFGMSMDDRTSDWHMSDVRSIVEYAARKWAKPLFLLGHSMGAFSVSQAAVSIVDPRIHGVVLSATPAGRRTGGSVPEIPLYRVKIPVLILHHRDDACGSTPFSQARWLPAYFTGSPRVALLEVNGGAPETPDPCDGQFHFHDHNGVEPEIAVALARWASGLAIPDRVEPGWKPASPQ